MANVGATGGPQRARGLSRLMLRKSVEQIQAETENSDLKRTLGPLNLVLLGIGCIIGTGIFVLTGQAAALHAGPGIMISFVITGTLCGFVALCYAELAAAVPVSGSAYSYSYTSMGEFTAWIMGLLLLLEYGLAASTVAVGWSGYLASLMHDIGWDLPVALQAAPGVNVLAHGSGEVLGKGVVNLPALIAIAAVTSLLVFGVSESATVNNVMVFVKVGVVVAFIGIGIFYVNPANWHPLIPPQSPAPPAGSDMSLGAELWRALVDVLLARNNSAYGIGGLITGAATIFFAYIGFEAVSTAGAEAKNPARDMPIGILGSLVVCTILYILTAAVLVGIVPYTDLNDPAPIAKAVNQIGLPWFAFVVKLGALAGLSSVMLVLLYGQTRIFYSMARDGLLPSPFAALHAKFKTPWINTIVVGFVAAGFAGFMGLDALAKLTNIGSLTAFALVCLTVLYLRIVRPTMHRPFRAPLFPLVPVLGAGMCLFLLMSLMSHRETATFFLVYVGVGLLIYFAYGMHHSKLAKGELVTGHEPAPIDRNHTP